MEGAGMSSMEGLRTTSIRGITKAGVRTVGFDSPPNQPSKDSAWPTRPFYTAPFGGGWASTMLFSTLCIAACRSYDGLAVGELLCFDVVPLVTKSAVVHGRSRLIVFVPISSQPTITTLLLRRQPMKYFRAFHFIPSFGSITSMWGKCFGD
ncbi:unnamed protein product [Ectocarpus sp. 12 AP-2014]